MANLRKQARGRECQIRIYGICNGNPETSVLCHLPSGGMGIKSSDIHASIGCSSCHDEVDRRTRKLSKEEAELALLQGMVRTQEIWIREGFL